MPHQRVCSRASYRGPCRGCHRLTQQCDAGAARARAPGDFRRLSPLRRLDAGRAAQLQAQRRPPGADHHESRVGHHPRLSLRDACRCQSPPGQASVTESARLSGLCEEWLSHWSLPRGSPCGLGTCVRQALKGELSLRDGIEQAKYRTSGGRPCENDRSGVGTPRRASAKRYQYGFASLTWDNPYPVRTRCSGGYECNSPSIR